MIFEYESPVNYGHILGTYYMCTNSHSKTYIQQITEPVSRASYKVLDLQVNPLDISLSVIILNMGFLQWIDWLKALFTIKHLFRNFLNEFDSVQ